MPNERKSTKRRFGVWLEPEEIAVIKEIAEANHMDVTAFLRTIAHGGDVVIPNRKEPGNGIR